MPPIVQQFIDYFEKLSDNQGLDLRTLYDENVSFQDPVHKFVGLKKLEAYFKKLDLNVKSASFDIHTTDVVGNKAFLEWTMHVTLKLPPGKKITAEGISILTFDDKIKTHRDYFDAGELFYENIPVLGLMIKGFKKTL